jgi:hypothetical protein
LNGSIFLPNQTKFFTPPIGVSGFASGPNFSIEQESALGKTYRVRVRSISKSGQPSQWSEAHDFTWELPPTVAPTPEPQVPWPARELPTIGNNWPLVKAKAFAMFNSENFSFDSNIDVIWGPWNRTEYPVGVLIARMGKVTEVTGNPVIWVTRDITTVLEYNFTSTPSEYRAIIDVNTEYLNNNYLPIKNDGHSYSRVDVHQFLVRRGQTVTDPAFFSDSNQVSTPQSVSDLLPAVLYREQVANAKFPTVSGDVIQVSPMMEQIAYQSPRIVNNQQRPGLTIWDPHIGIVSSKYRPFIIGAPNEGAASYFIDLYLLDTQPVQKGAAYRYSLVRFSATNGEIEEVIPAGTVTIP